MANIFAILTAIILAASTFLAFKNKEKYTEEISSRQTAEENLVRSQTRLKGLQEERDATIDERKAVDAETVAKQEDEESQTAKNAGMRTDIESKKGKTEANAAVIQDFKDKTEAIGEIADLASKIKRMKDDITSLEDEKAGNQAMFANLLAEKAGTEKSIQRYDTINKAHSGKRSYFNSARISAIYGPWGFVTLSTGNNGGTVAGSTLDVVRGDSVVAQLRVRSVEANRASADVIPDSLGEDVTLMVGDRVIPSAAVSKAQASN